MDHYNYSLLASSLGIMSCAMFFAMNMTFCYITIPCFLLKVTPSFPSKGSRTTESTVSSSHVVLQWQLLYNTGHLFGIGSAIISCFAYVAAAQFVRSKSRVFCYAAAICASGVIPFTLHFMVPTNEELHRRANAIAAGVPIDDEKVGGKVRVTGEEDSISLIRKWVKLNTRRSCFSLVGLCFAVVGLWK